MVVTRSNSSSRRNGGNVVVVVVPWYRRGRGRGRGSNSQQQQPRQNKSKASEFPLTIFFFFFIALLSMIQNLAASNQAYRPKDRQVVGSLLTTKSLSAVQAHKSSNFTTHPQQHQQEGRQKQKEPFFRMPGGAATGRDTSSNNTEEREEPDDDDDDDSNSNDKPDKQPKFDTFPPRLVNAEKWNQFDSSDSESDSHNTRPAPPLLKGRDDPRPRGLRLLMIGDSLMRYHYLSLTHFLLHGVWIDENPAHQPLENNGTQKRRPCPVSPQTYPTHSWNEFLFLTTRQGYEICDCFRLDKPNFNRNTVSENRYFWEPTLDNKVAMFQVLSRPQGRIDPTTAFAQIQNWTHVRPTEKTTPLLWKYRLKYGYSDIINKGVRPMGKIFEPTHAIMNRGLWEGHWFADEERRLDLLHALQPSLSSASSFYNITGIWRTTNYWRYRKLSKLNDDLAMSQFMRNHGHLVMNVSWTKYLHSRYYWDNVHFWEPVYRTWSEEMLSLMGHEFPASYQKLNRSSLLMTPEQLQQPSLMSSNKKKKKKQKKKK